MPYQPHFILSLRIYVLMHEDTLRQKAYQPGAATIYRYRQEPDCARSPGGLGKELSDRPARKTKAAWYRYLEAVDEQGEPIEVVDPLSDRLTDLARHHPGDAGQLLAIREIFGDKGQNARLNFAVRDALEDIHNLGIRQALTKWLEN